MVLFHDDEDVVVAWNDCGRTRRRGRHRRECGGSEEGRGETLRDRARSLCIWGPPRGIRFRAFGTAASDGGAASLVARIYRFRMKTINGSSTTSGKLSATGMLRIAGLRKRGPVRQTPTPPCQR